MSKLEPIVIDSSSEDEDLTEHDDEYHSYPPEQEINGKINTFLQVTGVSEAEKETAISLLRKYDYDLDVCIAQYFDQGNNESPQVQSQSHMKTDKEQGVHNDSATESIHPKPSKKWDSIMKKCRELNCQFVDEEFPPESSSLDGRKNRQSDSKDSSEAVIIKCRCNLPAVIKTVSKEGPNYGRFYLSCGKPMTKRKRKRDSSERPQTVTDQPCRFFQWDDNHEQTNIASKVGWANRITWFRYDAKHGYALTYPRGHYSPKHVQQGSVGNCWFLSALAVVAEKPYLIRKLIPHVDMNEIGCYEVNFCIDGRWTSVIVDSILPSVLRSTTDSKKSRIKGGVHTNDGIVVQPAFASGMVCWPALVEKAYAKVHGSYARLSGGFISEALFDLTGAPTERIHFKKIIDKDELFARLLSFSSSGFLMGVATSSGGDGLVACHAYSVLGIWEINNVLIGKQQKVTNFFAQKPKETEVSKDVYIVENSKTLKESKINDDVTLVERISTPEDSKPPVPTTVRLVRIRNPWGVKEWKGMWSANSEQWTEKIRNELGKGVCQQGDGTFFMSYEDMVQRFDHMDVCKCHEGWISNSRGSLIKLAPTGDPLLSCVNVFYCAVPTATWTFISLVQQKKRANASSQFWYSDISMIILHRKDNDKWALCECILQGVKRTCECEIFLSPEYEYCFIPFSFLSGKDEIQCGTVSKKRTHASFMFTSYSPTALDIRAENRIKFGHVKPLNALHEALMKSQKKISYPLGKKAILLAIYGDTDCVYFVVCNAGSDSLLLRLEVESSSGLQIVSGENKETLTISPGSKRIVLVLANDGIHLNPNVSFKYMSEVLSIQNYDRMINGNDLQVTYDGLRTTVPLCVMGELMCSQQVEDECDGKSGNGTIDERLWKSI